MWQGTSQLAPEEVGKAVGEAGWAGGAAPVQGAGCVRLREAPSKDVCRVLPAAKELIRPSPLGPRVRLPCKPSGLGPSAGTAARRLRCEIGGIAKLQFGVIFTLFVNQTYHVHSNRNYWHLSWERLIVLSSSFCGYWHCLGPFLPPSWVNLTSLRYCGCGS